MKFATFALITATTISAFTEAHIFQSDPKPWLTWEYEDLKAYLSDNKVPYSSGASLEEIRKLAAKAWSQSWCAVAPAREPWYSPTNVKQHVLEHFEGLRHLFGKSSENAASLLESPKDSGVKQYNNVKDWVFTTWTANELKKLLKHYNIKFKSHATRDDLAYLAQAHYNEIAKESKVSGKYPGSWLFAVWGESDLKKWLKGLGVDYSNAKSKEDLAKLVRDYMYHASVYADDQRDAVLEGLDLSGKSLFDKSGEIKDSAFESWSESELYQWLKLHQVEINKKAADSKEELVKTALQYKASLKSDVEYWMKRLSDRVSPVLDKSSKHADNIINDTFFVGVENWSRDRLKAFLNSREVAIPLLATKNVLVKLVKQNKYKPIKNFESVNFFQGWSKANIDKWTMNMKGGASSLGDDAASAASNFYKSLLENVEFYASKATEAVGDAASSLSDVVNDAVDIAGKKSENIKAAVSEKHASLTKSGVDARDSFFDYWSDIELKDYLKSFGIYETKGYTRDDLLSEVKKNTRLFVLGFPSDKNAAAEAANSHFTNIKYHGCNFISLLSHKFRTSYNYLYYTLHS